jgi:3-phosphoshikimate 1-carboxyvinyltransferase
MKVASSFDRFATTERPIKVLVEVEQFNNFMRKKRLSAYSNQRTKDNGLKVNIPANVSSQYISALMLVAPN